MPSKNSAIWIGELLNQQRQLSSATEDVKRSCGGAVGLEITPVCETAWPDSVARKQRTNSRISLKLLLGYARGVYNEGLEINL